jgi:hypothetical protein
MVPAGKRATGLPVACWSAVEYAHDNTRVLEPHVESFGPGGAGWRCLASQWLHCDSDKGVHSRRGMA